MLMRTSPRNLVLSITIADRLIDRLRRGKPLPTDDLARLSQALGENREFLMRRGESAFHTVSPEQSLLAIDYLEDVIDDCRILLGGFHE